jgi:hypothetical protein
MGGLTLDTGALLALERNRRDIVRVIVTATQGRDSIMIPATVIAEWWRGRTDRRDYVLQMGTIKDVDARIGKLAGEALASLNRSVEVNCPGYFPPPPHDRSGSVAGQVLMIGFGFARIARMLRILGSRLAAVASRLATYLS